MVIYENIKVIESTVVSEKNGTFSCELIPERYKYLRNTQKRLKFTIYGRNKFLRILSNLQ